jgi:2-amino-4-hydroxy-6-hydroxymethyldihydropteridine diphosphokinase
LGANVGQRLDRMRGALRGLAARAGIRVVAASPVYESAAHTLDPDETQPPFLNAVAHLRTTLAPEDVLRVTQALEREAGRDPGARRWAPRPLDLDLLVAYEADGTPVRRTSPRLTLPHPRLGGRRFVLQPLADLAPNLYVPPPFDDVVEVLLIRSSDADRPVQTPHELWDGLA